MTAGTMPQLLIQRHYDDIGAWGKEVGWDFNCEQIESGQMSAFAAAIGTADCMAMRGEFSHSFQQTGSPPEGMVTLGFPDQRVTEFDWCREQAQGGDIVNFSLNSGFAGTTPTGFAGFAISLSENLLAESAENLKLENTRLKDIRKQPVWRNVQHTTKLLRRQFSTALGNAGTPGGHKATNLFNQTAASRILQLISNDNCGGNTDNLATRSKAMHRALEYIENSNTVALTVTELCQYTGVSAPTLYRGFEEQFGTGPKRFLLIRCLSGVRKDLLSADDNVSVSEIANNWGFWHMGQFAADYKQCFGELPSDTKFHHRADT